MTKLREIKIKLQQTKTQCVSSLTQEGLSVKQTIILSLSIYMYSLPVNTFNHYYNLLPRPICPWLSVHNCFAKLSFKVSHIYANNQLIQQTPITHH